MNAASSFESASRQETDSTNLETTQAHNRHTRIPQHVRLQATVRGEALANADVLEHMSAAAANRSKARKWQVEEVRALC